MEYIPPSWAMIIQSTNCECQDSVLGSIVLCIFYSNISSDNVHNTKTFPSKWEDRMTMTVSTANTYQAFYVPGAVPSTLHWHNLQNNSMKYSSVLIPFSWWRKWLTEKLRSLTMFTQPVYSRARIQDTLAPESMLLTTAVQFQQLAIISTLSSL